MPVTDVIIDEIMATVRTVETQSMLDPKLVRKTGAGGAGRHR